ncbi:MAG: type II toxin-antitoxin system RelE/ParE family toxin [Rhizobiaceae bacterium]|nr:type II toxin-antitoxin system RelE/ParE family toxin [Rhizobiaceae bacterium]MCV0409143.1 type II toxin-antitoxin system RelE/ParE family toxin [Rhizobiaceae bacterium]
MAWTIELRSSVRHDLKKLDRKVADRVLDFLAERVASGDPRRIGEPLAGNLRGHWRYRVGDYRIICNLADERMVVLVIRIAHRSDVYR